MIAGKCILVRTRPRTSSNIGRIRQHAVCLRKLGNAVSIDARQMREQVAIKEPGKIDKTHLTILVTRLVDDRDIVASTDIHRVGIAIVLIGHIEAAAIGADIRHKSHVSGWTKGPDAISAGKDGDRTDARGCSQRQARTFGVHDPVGGVAPVQRQVISQQVPLFPCPPDTISPGRERARTELERVAIRRVERLITTRLHCGGGMIQDRLRLNRWSVREHHTSKKEQQKNT